MELSQRLKWANVPIFYPAMVVAKRPPDSWKRYVSPSYVTTLGEVTCPVIFVETELDGSGPVFNVSGNLQSGMEIGSKYGRRPESLASWERTWAGFGWQFAPHRENMLDDSASQEAIPRPKMTLPKRASSSLSIMGQRGYYCTRYEWNIVDTGLGYTVKGVASIEQRLERVPKLVRC